MSVVQLADMKAHLNVTFTTDDMLIQGKIDAAENLDLSFMPAAPLASRHCPSRPRPVESIRRLAAHLYENREAIS